MSLIVTASLDEGVGRPVAISEYHFMLIEIAGDRLFYQAITSDQKILDCGVLFRMADAETKPDKDTQTWKTACAAARPAVRTTP